MFDIKRAHQLEAIAELSKNVGLQAAELEALKEMKKMKDDLVKRIGETAADKVFDNVTND